MTRVFLIAQPTINRSGRSLDISQLKEFGEVVTLVERGIHPGNTPGAAADLIFNRLQDFDHTKDMLVWAGGDTLAAVLTGIGLADLDIPSFYYLRYDRRKDQYGRREDGYYTKIKINLDELPRAILDEKGKP
jgi:hypothetical protein